MSSIQGDIQEGLREHTSQLINSTNQLITIAKMAAADDPSLLTPVTDSIKVSNHNILWPNFLCSPWHLPNETAILDHYHNHCRVI